MRRRLRSSCARSCCRHELPAPRFVLETEAAYVEICVEGNVPHLCPRRQPKLKPHRAAPCPAMLARPADQPKRWHLVHGQRLVDQFEQVSRHTGKTRSQQIW